MKTINTKFSFNESLEQMDFILKSGEIIEKRDFFIPGEDNGPKSSILNASVICVKYSSAFKPGADLETWAKVNNILISQIFNLAVSQPLLLNMEWDGDKLFAIFNTTLKEHVDSVLDSVGKILSLTDVINYKIKETGLSFNVFAAFDYKRVLSVPTGENNTLWKIDNVQELERLLDEDNGKRLVITEFIYNNLKDSYRKLFESNSSLGNATFYADIVNIGINNWLKERKSENE